MLGKLFGRAAKPAPVVIVARLNARLQPMQRGDIFEDPLDAQLRERAMGKVVGGGTEMAPAPYGIAACDIEIALNDGADGAVQQVIEILERLGAPKGSVLRLPDGAARPFGLSEGMAIFLNGTDLPAEVYATSDVNQTIDGLHAALGDAGFMMGHWEGPEETALYFYGMDYARMQALAAAYAETDALCSRCRFEQIA
ncbi:MAG: hypothetical protein MUD11_01440 [Rhodobacteraceae bacterium]|nr:hypothetical protein [Paracoccaceae bacterium]